MENLDLNIDNYDLQEILNLFQMTNPYTYKDLKVAYKLVLKTHPDKSKLPKEYFLFFSKAFKLLKKVYDYTHKNENCILETNKNHGYDNTDYEVIDVSKMSVTEKKTFQKKFNQMFEKVKIYDEEQDNGYAEWFKNEQYEQHTKVNNIRDLNEYITKQKEEQRNHYLVTYSGVQEMNSNFSNQQVQGSGLIREKPSEYGSTIFSKLQYEDLKKAHTETVVPVTEQDFLSRKHFNSVDELERYRKSNSILARNMEEIKYKNEINEDKQNIHNAYKMMKQMEQIEKSNQIWNANFKQLTN